MTGAILLSPPRLRQVRLRNRVVGSPMCMHAAREGFATDWHFAHFASFALGGAALVFTEGTAVEAGGRISHSDLWLWAEAQIAPLKRIAAFLRGQGAVPGIKLAHAGRKAATQAPWNGFGPLTAADAARGEPPWPVEGPSALAAAADHQVSAELAPADLARIRAAWRDATGRAAAAGFEALELHGGHGYLPHSFLSPISNRRTDRYGGDHEGRLRFPLEIARIVREAWPAGRPLFYRLSAVDGIDGGWEIEDTTSCGNGR